MYVKVTNGTPTPYTIGQLRRDNPNVSFPRIIPDSVLADYSVYPVSAGDVPDFNERTETVTQSDTPSVVNGQWVYTWTKSSKTDDEISQYDSVIGEGVRAKRNELLKDTDHYGLSDVTMSAAMTTYRQALRDITDHANFPNLEDADWPTKP